MNAPRFLAPEQKGDKQRTIPSAVEGLRVAQPLLLSGVTFSAAPRAIVRDGLLGWVSFLLNGAFRIGGVMLRRTEAGTLALSFPGHRDRFNGEHPFLAPLTDDVRLEVERQVFDALPFGREAANP